MTNEQAISVLKSLICYYNDSNEDDCYVGFDSEDNEALNMAINLLKQTSWIPIKTRSMTEEEKEHFFEYADSRCDDTYTILDCPLPDDGQEVILSVNGYVSTDIFCRDSAYGCYFESYDIDDVDAWMPFPETYKAESEENVIHNHPCEDCYYNDGEVHAECVVCNKAESEDEEVLIAKYPEWVEAQLKMLDEKIEEIYREYAEIKVRPDEAMRIKKELYERTKPFVDEKVRLITNSHPTYIVDGVIKESEDEE